MKTITLTVCNRPEYARQTIESLRANNLAGYTLLIAAEERYPETVAECRKIDFMPVQMFYNFASLTIFWIAKRIYDIAFHLGSRFNVAIEDDTPLSPDALDFANWFYEHPNRDDYLMACFFSQSRSSERPLEVVECPEMCPWGYCFTREKYEQYIAPTWMCDPRGWDWSMCSMMRAKGLKSLAPVLSRSRNIGRLGGVFCTPELYDRSFVGHVASERMYRQPFVPCR